MKTTQLLDGIFRLDSNLALSPPSDDNVLASVRANESVHGSEREKLPLLARIEGPAILAQFDSTTVLPPDCVAEGDREGNIIIQVSGDARG